MIENVQIESVSVPVSDQDQAMDFYVDTLGFELLVDNTWRKGMRWSEVAPENSATSLMLVTWSACMLPRMYGSSSWPPRTSERSTKSLLPRASTSSYRLRRRPGGRKRCSATPMAMPSCSGSMQ